MKPATPYSELLLASAAVFLGLTLATALAWRALRGVQGLGRIALGYALLVAAMGLFAMAGTFGVAIPNLALIAAGALLHDGVRVLYGRSSAARALLVLGALTFLATTWMARVAPSSVARGALVTGLLAALLGGAVLVSWRSRRPRDLLDSAATLSLGACTLVLASRAGLAVWTRSRLLAGDPITALSILTGTVAAVVWTLAILASANRRLGQELVAQGELFARLLSVARVAGEGPGLQAALEGTLKLARTATGATGSSLMLLDESGSFTRGIYTRGEELRELRPEEAEPLLREGLAGWVARQRRTVVVSDVAADPRWMPPPAPDLAIGSTLAVPIATGAALVGILTLDHAEPHAFGDEQRRLMESAAAQIALVLRNVQIADARLRAARRELLLNAVLRLSARRLEAAAIARAAVDAIAEGTGWEGVCVAIPAEEGGLRLLATSGVSDQPASRGVIGRAYATGQIQVVEDVRADPDYVPGMGGARAELAVPLRQGGRTFGVLDVESTTPLGHDEVALCESLAEAIGLGLENARLSREREELTSTMVHDLRSPMVSIMGSLQFLRRAPGLDASERRLLEMAERNSERLASLVTAILDVSRLEGGATRIERSRFSLSGLTSEVLRLAGPRAAARRIELVDAVPGDLPDLDADRNLVLRVLENLVGNAIKFTDEGGGPVRLAASVEEPGSVQVSVSDSGPGVDEAARRRLFQKFAPGDHQARGSGLGLAFCRLAVEANGGRIWLAEPDGDGARFVFTVPT